MMELQQALEEEIGQMESHLAALREAHGVLFGARRHIVKRRQTVAPERLAMVQEYLQKRPKSKQSDIAKDTGLNSGIVSTAVRTLVDEDKIVAEHINGARPVYSIIDPDREIVVDPGEGVRDGRKK